MDRIKLIYIAGTDRSGSTLLDMIIGGAPGFFSLGEAHRYHDYSTSPEELLCSCGTPLPRCAFWSAVSEKLGETENWQPELLAPLGWKKRLLIHTLDRIIPGGALTKNFIRRYAHTNWTLFDAVRQVSGAEHLVDSSKDFVRAWMLHRSGLFDVVPIYITRAVEDYIVSVRKPQPGRGSGVEIGRRKAILKWFFRNFETRRLIGRIRRDYVQISYRNLATNPSGVIDAISSMYNLPLSFDPQNIPAGKHHMIGGNNMKLSALSEIRYDKKEDALAESSALTGALNRLFVRDNI